MHFQKYFLSFSGEETHRDPKTVKSSWTQLMPTDKVLNFIFTFNLNIHSLGLVPMMDKFYDLYNLLSNAHH